MENKDGYTVFTVGHSNHTIEVFAGLLNFASITCVIDVRSVPMSSYNPQFNMDALQQYLKDIGITYLHFGEEFGARHTEPELLDTFGKVEFEKVWETKSFLSGISRLKVQLEQGYKIALMCAEADPFDCHRFSMIAQYLVNNGFSVQHILKDYTIIDNSVLEKQLLKKYDKQIPKATLFEFYTPEEQLKLAYRLRNKDIAYNPSNP